MTRKEIEAKAREPYADAIAKMQVEHDSLAADLAEARRLLAGFVEAMNVPCAYTGSAGCDLLPSGVRRSPCYPCQARAFLSRGDAS